MTLGINTHMGGAPHTDQLRAALIAQIEPLAEILLGPRNRTRSSRTQWRWGSNGSLALEIAGPKRGQWYSHETGEGGDLFELIVVQRQCSFDDAVRWAATFTGVSVAGDAPPRHAAEDIQRRQDQQRQREQQKADEAVDEQHRVRDAQAMWQRSQPVGDLVDHYLRVTRAIPRPIDGWPEAVRFLPDTTAAVDDQDEEGNAIRPIIDTAGALIMPATLPDGTLRAVQRVYLDAQAKNLRYRDGHKIKLSKGVREGAVARLPGPANGPLLLVEGPETGLSVWAATRHETHIAFGALRNHPQPPLGRRVVLCRDDDPIHGHGDHALRRLISQWRQAGVDVVVATPWCVRRGDRSDFNSVLMTSGLDAVRERIATALSLGIDQPMHRVPIEEARDICADGIERFFAAAIAYDAMRDEAEAEAGAAEEARVEPRLPNEIQTARKAKADAEAAARTADEARARASQAPKEIRAEAQQAARAAAKAASAAANLPRRGRQGVAPGVPVPDSNNWMWSNLITATLDRAYASHRDGSRGTLPSRGRTEPFR